MKYILTIKQDIMTSQAEKVVNKYLLSLNKKLMNFAEDIIELSLFIKKHEKNHFFSGMISLTLPRKKLIAKLEGHTLNEVIHQGFNRINKEFEKYKGLHFKSSSKYPNHASIKKLTAEEEEKTK